jgi:hypothetical protein
LSLSHVPKQDRTGHHGRDFGRQRARDPAETDSLAEGNGFELSVPREIGSGFENSSELGPIDPSVRHIIRVVVGLGKPMERLRRLE